MFCCMESSNLHFPCSFDANACNAIDRSCDARRASLDSDESGEDLVCEGEVIKKN